ncbi:MAG: type II toxin-antitoxin system VapC family toxin [Polyangiaceae bacterium]|nr:type II toxin-antitoxin system VapC family toxin [Polyangiaceae bacterium]
MHLVLDASVAIASCNRKEKHFEAARARVGRALRGLDELTVPTLFGVEVAANLARIGYPAEKIHALVRSLTSAPHLVVPLGAGRMWRAMKVAVGGVGGADAVYVWLASARRLQLCTLDGPMASRAAAFCKVMAP